MSAGRFGIVQHPGDVRPAVHVVDNDREIPCVVFTATGEGAVDRCEWLAAELSEASFAHALPPVFDLPGDPTVEPF